MQDINRLAAAAIAAAAVTAAASQPATDPVGFPAAYRDFQQVRTTTVKQDPPHGAVFANVAAASVEKAAQLPYPYGSVVVMEWRREGKSGQPGEIVRLDVMRKERGYGQRFGADQTGEWEYASYEPGGKLLTGAAEAAACAKCHLKAGASKDFVYKGRLP
jgi:hypothetical protein